MSKDKVYSERRASQPKPGSAHYPFYRAIATGGRVWRDDKLNGVKEWLDLNHPGIQGHAANIRYYGHLSLSLTHDETTVKQALEKLQELMQAKGWAKLMPGGGGVNVYGFLHAVTLQIQEDESEAARTRTGG